ncbi:MAG: heavy metal translocating P-type ATPase metal-binding domain-containing protein [Bacteroidetes bacterium]|nr:heavy metal translocating P-type ATPase metal-binding domain-containing protein [Bacteroidota bacterium]
METTTQITTQCYHCGDNCSDESIHIADKIFCCEGCKQVYLLLSENDLCVYYDFDKNPGLKAKGKFVSERFAYLDDAEIQKKLVQFSSGHQTNVTFSLPQMHCSSCVYLLENLYRINPGIIKSQSNFQRKEVFIVFDPQQISLRKVVELLAFIGYEPSISLKDTVTKKTATFNRQRIYRIGVAGFCFANIMMLSFPEYFSSGNIEQAGLKTTFSWLNLALSLPVLFYSASGFFVSAWKGLRQRFLNIDAPIALAIVVTYARSYYEIISGHGAGYLDSGTGIVFFMLAGRWFQDKTYESFSFDRDYRSYFPLGVSVISNGIEKNIPVTQLQKGNRIIIRNEEMIPADAILMSGNANVDYSFVSGENVPVQCSQGTLIYAGGKQVGSAIELEVTGDVSQSYITQLWNNDVFHNKKNTEKSFIHPWSRYFTLALFTVAISTVGYWWMHDTSKILPAVSSVLIVACPCSLLLSATFTYGNMLRIFGRNKMYLKNASVMETMASINTVVLDKTGTITQNQTSGIVYEGTPLTPREWRAVKAITKQSSHPLSKLIAASVSGGDDVQPTIKDFTEVAGKGLSATVNDIPMVLGSAGFMRECNHDVITYDTGTHIHLMMNNVHMGRFTVSNQYRDGVAQMAHELQKNKIALFLLSGDNNTEQKNLQKILGASVPLQFNQSPQQKLDFIRSLQHKNKNVLMLGDGLNDAGALMQSQVGIAVSDNAAQFTPACDAILDGGNVKLLDKFIAYAKSGKTIVTASFILSILYNIVGLSFAVQGLLSPMVAAILMPVSSISIVLLVTTLSSISARMKGLR